MNIDFEWWLTWSVILLGAIALLDRIFWAPKRSVDRAEPWPVEWAKSFWPVLLAVLILRSFVIEPFRIPSGSLKPTLLIGDFVLVNKFVYGLRLPVLHTKIFHHEEPKRGDIVVFHSTAEGSNMDMIKRVIGLPGDRVRYMNKVIYVNDTPALQTDFSPSTEEAGLVQGHEDLLGTPHEIYQNPDMPAQDMAEQTVPAGHYFVMGDNRDNSSDSRYWGFLPEENLIGQAFRIALSWDGDASRMRWSRVGEAIR